MTRPSVFEVKQNTAGQWFWHERASNGKIVDVAQAFSSKWNAQRAAKRKAWKQGGKVVTIAGH